MSISAANKGQKEPTETGAKASAVFELLKSEAVRLFLGVEQWQEAEHTGAYVSISATNKGQKESTETILTKNFQFFVFICTFAQL